MDRYTDYGLVRPTLASYHDRVEAVRGVADEIASCIEDGYDAASCVESVGAKLIDEYVEGGCRVVVASFAGYVFGVRTCRHRSEVLVEW